MNRLSLLGPLAAPLLLLGSGEAAGWAGIVESMEIRTGVEKGQSWPDA
ncbi:MAG: hypothetical protein ABI856_14725 [Nitrospira sp.]